LISALITLTGCGKNPTNDSPPAKVVRSGLINDETIENAVCGHLAKKPGDLNDSDLTKVVELTLSYTPITDAGLKELSKLKGLTHLYLNDTKITDAGLKELAKFKQLKSISLQRTKITDAGVRQLLKLPNLVELDLRITAVTKRGVLWVQKALPKCRLYVEFEKISGLFLPQQNANRNVYRFGGKADWTPLIEGQQAQVEAERDAAERDRRGGFWCG